MLAQHVTKFTNT